MSGFLLASLKEEKEIAMVGSELKPPVDACLGLQKIISSEKTKA